MQTVVYLVMWALLFVFMMRFGCGAHVMGHTHHRHHGRNPHQTSKPGAPAEAIDPVCGMKVSTSSAKSSVHRGHAFFFCSADCRDRFEAAPDNFASVQMLPQ